MKKSILISIQPQHVKNILSGKKTMELRKSVPKDFKGWVYIYCTKSKPYLHRTEKDILKVYPNTERFILNDDPMVAGFDILNGHVVARFCFNNFITLQKDEAFDIYGDFYGTDTEDKFYFGQDILSDSCIEFKDLNTYWMNGKLFALNIKKLEVFDKTMELSDFYSFGSQDHHDFITTSKMIEEDERECWIKSCRLKKAPQSWMYVYTNEQLP